MRNLLLATALLLTACAGQTKYVPMRADPSPAPVLLAPGAPPAPIITPEQIQQAEMLRLEGMRFLYSKDPLEKNPRAAYDKFLAAAMIGDPVSMDQVGGFHSTGLAGVEKSCSKAIEWFEKSANGGYPMAMNNLAYSLVTCPEKKLRNPDRAEELVKFLFQNSEGFLAWLDTYAAVLAAQGHFTQAAKTLDVVIDLASFTDSNPERIDEMKAARKAYLKKKTLEQGHDADPHIFKKPIKKQSEP